MVTNCLIVWLNYHKKWNNVYKWFLNILITQSISLLMQSSYQLIPLPPTTPYEFHWLLFPLSFHSLFNFVSSDVEWEWLIILNYSYLQNVVFNSNYWPYSQILISCLPTNCGMSLDTYISGSKLFVRYYIRGECREGDNCRFSHDSKDVPVSIT